MISEFLVSLWFHFVTLLSTPVHHPQMLWIVIPLLVIIVMMTIYFAIHHDEELGWNTALGNSLVLIFVAVDLLRTVYMRSEPGSLYNFMHNPGLLFIIGLLFIGGIILMFVNFTHFLPKKISYFLSSPLTINLAAYTTITYVYSEVTITITSFIAGGILFFTLLFGFLFLGYCAKKWWKVIEKMKAKEDIDNVRKEKKSLTKHKREIEEREKNLKRSVKKKQREEKEHLKVAKELGKISQRSDKKKRRKK